MKFHEGYTTAQHSLCGGGMHVLLPEVTPTGNPLPYPTLIGHGVQHWTNMTLVYCWEP